MIVELHHHAKFRDDQSNRCRDIAIFEFFKMAALTVGTVKRVELRQYAKFLRNRSNYG